MAYAGGAWSGAREAAEGGGVLVRMLEIDVTDPDAILPNTDAHIRTRTLYFSDRYHLRDDSDSDYAERADAVVTDWGSISWGGNHGNAFEVIGDVVVTVTNEPPRWMVPRSSVGGSVVALVPEPTANNLKLSQLFGEWQMQGATCRLKAIKVSGPKFDITDSVRSGGQSITLFTGVLTGYTVGVGTNTVTMNLAQDTGGVESPIQGRLLVDAWDDADRANRAPVVYGEYGYRGVGDGLFTPSGGAVNRLYFAAAGIHMPVSRAFPWKRSSSASKTHHIWNDATGVNITTQPAIGTGDLRPDDYSGLFIFEPQSGGVALLVEDTDASDTDGETDWQVGTTGTVTELATKTHRYAKGTALFPAYEIAAGESGLTNPDYLVDGKHTTSATLDCGSTKTITLKIPATSSLGEITDPSAIGAYLLVDTANTTYTAPCAVKLGWVTQSGGVLSTTTIPTGGLGIGQINYHWSHSGSNKEWQDSTVSPTRREPMLVWDWTTTRDTVGAIDKQDVYIYIRVSTANAGDSIKIIGGGLIVSEFRMRKRVITGARQDLAMPWRDPEYQINRPRFVSSVSYGYEGTFPSFYVGSSKTTIDDSSGTYTGTASATIENPADIVRHLGEKWGNGVTSADYVTGVSTFGSFAVARSDLNSWVTTHVTGGVAWKAVSSWSDTTYQGAAQSLAAESPCVFFQDAAAGTYQANVYPVASPALAMQFQDAAGNIVKFHPGAQHPDASKTYDAYGLQDFECGTVDSSQLATAVRVNFARFAPTGKYEQVIYANPDEQKVWNNTTEAYVTGSSGTLYTACSDMETLLGKRTQEAVYNLNTVWDRSTATAFLYYKVSQHCKPRTWVRGTVGLEGYALRPGHCIRISNDMNLVSPFPRYGMDDWEDVWFVVRTVDVDSSGRQPVVTFYAEELVTL